MEGWSHNKHKRTHKVEERGKEQGVFWRLIRRKNMISDKLSKQNESDNKFYNIWSIWQKNQTVRTCLLSPARIWIPLWGRLQHVWNLFLFQTWPPGFGHIYYLDLLCYPITFITNTDADKHWTRWFFFTPKHSINDKIWGSTLFHYNLYTSRNQIQTGVYIWQF